MRWLALREHSRSELRRKLMQRFRGMEPPAAIDAVLDTLATQGLLSDERFVESRVHARQARFGLRRIVAEVGQHGLELPPGTRDALAASELDRARATWQRRYGAPPADRAARLRQQRFLLGRGFSPEVIRRVVPREEAPPEHPEDG